MLTPVTATVTSETTTPFGVFVEERAETFMAGLPVPFEQAARDRDEADTYSRAAAVARAKESAHHHHLAAIARELRSRGVPAKVDVSAHRPYGSTEGTTHVYSFRRADWHAPEFRPAKASYGEVYTTTRLAVGDRYVTVDFEEVRESVGRFRSRGTGKYRMLVEVLEDGHYDRRSGRSVSKFVRKSFPQKKFGGYNYANAAEAIAAQWRSEQAGKARRRAELTNEQRAADLRAELGMGKYAGALQHTTQADRPVRVQLNQACDEATARALVAAIRTVLPTFGG